MRWCPERCLAQCAGLRHSSDTVCTRSQNWQYSWSHSETRIWTSVCMTNTYSLNSWTGPLSNTHYFIHWHNHHPRHPHWKIQRKITFQLRDYISIFFQNYHLAKLRELRFLISFRLINNLTWHKKGPGPFLPPKPLF